MPVSRENSFTWEKLIETISASIYYKRLFSKTPITITSLPIGFLSLLLSSRVSKNNLPLLVITEIDVAEKLFLMMNDLLPGLAHFAPSIQKNRETSIAFITEDEKRFADAYNYLVEGCRGVLVVSGSALNQKVRSPNDRSVTEYHFKTYDKINITNLLSSLSLWGYGKESEVITPKTYSVRGGIIDIYPLYAKYPIRVETFGNLVESIRLFNPVSQLSIETINRVRLFAPSGFSPNNKISLKDLIDDHFEDVYYVSLNGELLYISNTKVPGAEEVEFKGDKLNKKTVFTKTKKVYIFSSEKSIGKKIKDQLGRFSVIEKPLPFGFSCDDLGFVVYGYSDLRVQRPSSINEHSLPYINQERLSLSNIEWGDPVVHENYGIGLYRGLSEKKEPGNHQDSIVIEYANGGIVRVPIDRFDKVHKYISAQKESFKLSTLGTKHWEIQKAAVLKSAESIVEDLVALYSSKQTARTFSYSHDDEFVEMLAANFPFEETPDQEKAIHDVLQDLNKPFPMDRVIFGDVGFGKTEVALRGAMKVIAGGKQVFFLAPTTLLADQHFITSKNRLGDLGVKIALLSRFQTKKEQTKIIEQIESGNIDLIVGTHRLFSNDVVVNNLGLLIIDEEHRFGVKHKERLRTLKRDVDVLTLTATPIPRTLQQSLFGIRDVSRINTPPLERLSIKTTVQYFNWDSIKEQMDRELRRGGQIYFLHNDINSIPFVVDKIRTFFPNHATVGAHGSIPSKNLEKIILSFFNGEIDILVCTTIIESGLDITRANTIIINNAHRFGMAQLYQIRGRVGRGNIQAYCWLLIPNKTLKKEAYNRLKAIEHFSSLGSGYQIALKDLEIRGAGNLFGYEQSGNIGKVGYDLYCKILKKALDDKLKTPGSKDVMRPVVSFKEGAYLSEKYMPLIQDRIYYYQRLASAISTDEVAAVKKEIIDRFGKAVKEAKNVFSVAYIRELFTDMGVKKILLDTNVLELDFSSDSVNRGLDFSKLYNVLQSQNRKYFFKQRKNNSVALAIKTGAISESVSMAKEINRLLREKLSV